MSHGGAQREAVIGPVALCFRHHLICVRFPPHALPAPYTDAPGPKNLAANRSESKERTGVPIRIDLPKNTGQTDGWRDAERKERKKGMREES